MKVAVNTRFLLKNNLEGIGQFTHQTLRKIVKNNPEVEFHFLFDRAYDPSFIYEKNVVPHVLFPQARHPLLWYWWFEWSIPNVLKKIKPAVFFSPDGYCSLKTKVPTVLTIHDLAFEHYPEDVNKLVAKYYSYFTPRYVKKAQRIVTVSNFSKTDIQKQYQVEPSKIDVVYNAGQNTFKPISEPEKTKVLNRYTDGHPYFLFIGALHPRKNIKRLLEAFEKFKLKSNAPHKLILVGRKGWGTTEMEKAFQGMQFKSDVIMTGRLSSLELSGVLASAFAFMYVPYFEGFGIPIVEAQSCGVPVITSNVASMPEVAGEAGLLVDPFSVSSIANAMLELYNNQAMRNSLVAKGLNNSNRFSWDLSASTTWESILKVI